MRITCKLNVLALEVVRTTRTNEGDTFFYTLVVVLCLGFFKFLCPSVDINHSLKRAHMKLQKYWNDERKAFICEVKNGSQHLVRIMM